MEFIIEKMRLSHVGQIASIERECFSTPWSETSLKAEIDNPNARFFAAVSGGRVIGYCGMHSVCGENYIDNIAVSGPYRKKGIATALLRKLEETAKAENGEFLSLEVRESNTAAVSLYLKNGYVKAGVRKNFYQQPAEDGIIMTKEIGQ